MAIEITGNKLSFDGVEFKQGDVTASKDFELKRKSDTGIPIKRLRAFESSSTFIDMNRAAGRQRNKFGSKLNKGETLDVFVKDTYEAFHIDPFLVSIGPKANIPIELTGSISTQTDGVTQTSAFLNGFTGFDQDNYGFILDNGLITTGIITADNALSVAPGTSLIYGALGTIGGSGNTAETSQDIVIQPNTTTTINVSDENPSYTIAAGINYTISVGADVTIVSSNQTFTGGDIGDTGVEINEEEIVIGPDTTVGTGGVAFTQVISTNTIAGAGATTLNVTNENLSVTINQGIEYTIPYGSNVTIINSNQTFTGGTVDDLTVTGNTSLTDLEVEGSIDQVFTNNVPITSSLTLTNVTHGMGRQLLVRSGSTPVYTSGASEGLPTLPYPNGGRYIANPAGEFVLTLPAADIGLSFHIINKGGFSSFNLPGYGFQGPPSIKISPSGSNKFIYGAGGSAGVAGKAIINHSSSFSNGDYVVVSCVSIDNWMIQQLGGTWTDEA